MSLDVPFTGFYWYLYDSNCATLACSVLFIADYLDTLPMEISMFWAKKTRPRVSLPAILFFIGRYSMLLSLAIQLSSFGLGYVTDRFCTRTAYIAAMGTQLSALCTSALLLMRAWAICRRNQWILYSGMTLIFARFGYGMFAHSTLIFPAAYVGGPIAVCDWAPETTANAIRLQSYEFVVPFLALTFDTLVLAAIVTPTFRLIMEMRRLRQSGFIERVVRDGVLYYIVALGLDICMTQGVFSGSSETGSDPLSTFQWIISPFFNPIPNILASRIVLAAHAYHQEYDRATSTRGGDTGLSHDVEFSRFVGSIGAPMRSRLLGDDLDADVETEGIEVTSNATFLCDLHVLDTMSRDAVLDFDMRLSQDIAVVPAACMELVGGQRPENVSCNV